MNDPKKIVQGRLSEASGKSAQDPTFGQVRNQQSAQKQLIASLTIDEKRIMLSKYDAATYLEVGVDESILYDWFMDGLPGWAKQTDEEVSAGWDDVFGPEGQNQFDEETILSYIEDFLGKKVEEPAKLPTKKSSRSGKPRPNLPNEFGPGQE